MHKISQYIFESLNNLNKTRQRAGDRVSTMTLVIF